jgi:hypothetical protein
MKMRWLAPFHVGYGSFAIGLGPAALGNVCYAAQRLTEQNAESNSILADWSKAPVCPH